MSSLSTAGSASASTAAVPAYAAGAAASRASRASARRVGWARGPSDGVPGRPTAMRYPGAQDRPEDLLYDLEMHVWVRPEDGAAVPRA